MILTSPTPPSSERGNATMEFALSALILFSLILGCIVMAMAFYTYEVLNEYARDASRYAIVHGNNCVSAVTGDSCSISTGATANAALKTFLNHEILPGINGNNLTLSTTYSHAPGLTTCFATNCNGTGDQVAVSVSYPYLYAIPFIHSRSFTMQATSTMIISQ